MPSSEKFRNHVLEQFNGKLLEGGFRVTTRRKAIKEEVMSFWRLEEPIECLSRRFTCHARVGGHL